MSSKKKMNNNCILIYKIIFIINFIKRKMNTSNISICLVGTVSVGKSVLLNALFCKDLTQSKIKRTTMVPCLFIENEDLLNIDNSQEIKKKISDLNQQIIQKTENDENLSNEECQELIFNVSRLDIHICDGAYTNIYDIPGLNDSRTKQLYYDYLRNNFYKFNVIIYMVDIHSGLNTSDEMDILKFVIENIKNQKEKNIGLLVVVNKADDMQLRNDESGNEILELSGELAEMFDQVKMTVTNEFAKENLSKNLIDIIPLCALDSFLYRVIKKDGDKFELKTEDMLKIGINQMGKQFSKKSAKQQKEIVTNIIRDHEFVNDMIKLSGFSFLEKSLYKYLQIEGNGNEIRIENYMYELKRLKSIRDILLKNYSGTKFCLVNIENIKNDLNKIKLILNGIKNINIDKYNVILNEYHYDFLYSLNKILSSFSNNYFNDIYTIQSIYISIKNIIKENILNLYQDETHDLVIDKIMSIMKTTIKNKVPLNRMNQIYQIFYELKPDFDWINQKMTVILKELVENKNMFNTFIIQDENYSKDIKECIKSFNLLENLDRNMINQYINILMMNILFKVQSDNNIQDKMIQKMIFNKSFEISLSTLILDNMKIGFEENMKNIFQMGSMGWKDEYMENDKFIFEIFYLNYQYKYNMDNIRYENTDFFIKTEKIIENKIIKDVEFKIQLKEINQQPNLLNDLLTFQRSSNPFDEENTPKLNNLSTSNIQMDLSQNDNNVESINTNLLVNEKPTRLKRRTKNALFDSPEKIKEFNHSNSFN